MSLTQQTKLADTAQEKLGRYRWTICGLLFFATTVNYLDRQVLSLLQPLLAEKFGWSNTDYANIAAVFQFTYAISMLFAGRIIDRLGTKWGYAWALIIWSLAAILHAYAEPLGRAVSPVFTAIGFAAVPVSVLGFMVARAFLGFGESGNFPAAIKATAEYFPKKERSFATGIFNSGSNVGPFWHRLPFPGLPLTWAGNTPSLSLEPLVFSGWPSGSIIMRFQTSKRGSQRQSGRISAVTVSPCWSQTPPLRLRKSPGSSCLAISRRGLLLSVNS